MTFILRESEEPLAASVPVVTSAELVTAVANYASNRENIWSRHGPHCHICICLPLLPCSPICDIGCSGEMEVLEGLISDGNIEWQLQILHLVSAHNLETIRK